MSEVAKNWLRALALFVGAICLLGVLLVAGMYLVGELFAFGDRWLGPPGGTLLVLASFTVVGVALCYLALRGSNHER